MLPPYARENVTNTGFGNAILGGDIYASHTFAGQSFDLNNISLSQLGVPVALAASVAAFIDHIVYVVSLSTQKEMIGIAARGVIAFMAYGLPTRYWAVGYLIANSVRWMCSVEMPYRAVSKRVFCASPFPTIIGRTFRAIRPKLFIERGVFGSAARMSSEEAKWFALDPSHFGMTLACDVGFLSASAMAVTVGNIVRGIMGLHKNLHFLCQAQGRVERRLGIFAWFYAPIIPQVEAMP